MLTKLKKPTGIYYRKKLLAPIDSTILEKPFYNGVSHYFRWEIIEAVEGTRNFADIVTEFERYVEDENCKNISFAFIAGANSPSWLANYVTTLEFAEFRHGGKGKEFTINQPVVFENAYLDKLLFAHRELVKILRENRKVWSKITHVFANVVQMTTPEFRLPADVEEETTDAVALWNSVGYTQQKVIDTFKKGFTALADIYDNRTLVVPVLGVYNSAFPAIGTLNIYSEIFKWLADNYKERVLIQFTAVTSAWDINKPGKVVQLCFDNDLRICAQFKEFEYGENEATVTKFENTFQKCVDFNFQYVEIFPPNFNGKYDESIEEYNLLFK